MSDIEFSKEKSPSGKYRCCCCDFACLVGTCLRDKIDTNEKLNKDEEWQVGLVKSFGYIK